MRVLESQGSRRDEREESVAVMVSEIKFRSGKLDNMVYAPINAASLSFRRLVMTLARSASVMRRSGLAKGSNIPPLAFLISTVPSKCRSFMWFMCTA